jgi:ribosome-associated heat shock protein Hsp15
MPLTPRSPQAQATPTDALRVRLDKWLWAARFYKTRALAAEDIDKHRVSVNGQVAKASREVRLNDQIELRQGAITRCIAVCGLSAMRGPASVAQTLYQETPESVAARERHRALLRMGAEPALTLEQGRPTKKDRRQLAEWNRWSAVADPEN